jgi:four helix bundle protein
MATELEELRVLQIAEQFSDKVWKIVGGWNEFARDTVGKQIARAADSIGANIAEAYGRYHYGEKINLLYYARGSLFEIKYWLNRCKTHQLISETDANEWTQNLGDIARQINSFVKNLKSQRRDTSEKTLCAARAEYSVAAEPPNEIVTTLEFEWLISKHPYLEPPFSLQSLLSNLESI